MSITTMASFQLCNNLHIHHQHQQHFCNRRPISGDATIFNLYPHPKISIITSTKHGQSFLANQRFSPSLVTFNPRAFSKSHLRKMDVAMRSSVEPGVPFPSGPPSGSNWKGWILGVLLTIILPLMKHKTTPFLALKKEVDMVVEAIDTVAEIVEQVAEGVEKIADGVADNLPDGKLKDAARCIESLARETARDAHIADEFLDKVEAMGKEMEKDMKYSITDNNISTVEVAVAPQEYPTATTASVAVALATIETTTAAIETTVSVETEDAAAAALEVSTLTTQEDQITTTTTAQIS